MTKGMSLVRLWLACHSLPQIGLAILGRLTAQHIRSPIIQPENNPTYKKYLDHDLKTNPIKKQNNIHLQKVQIQPDQLFKQTKRSKTKQPVFEFTLLDSWYLEPNSWFVILSLPDPCDFKAEPGAKLPHILPTASWRRHPPSQWVIIIYFFIFIVNINNNKNNIILNITNY